MKIQVPEPVKLKSGSWNIRLYYNGKRHSITAPTRQECIVKAQDMKIKHLAGLSGDPSKITLYDAIDSYIESRDAVLSPSTIKGYRVVQKHRFQSVMNKRLSDINNWQALVNSEAKKYNPKSVRNAYMFICSVLKENGVEAPKLTLPQIIRNERPFLSPTEIPSFMAAIRGHKVELAALLALHGLRASEVLALTKDDIKDGIIRVHGSMVYNEHQELVYKATNKNTMSNREIPIMIPRLKELLEDAPDGKLINMCNATITPMINRICVKNNLPEVGMHGLRHSFASLAHYVGLSERETMQLGGWSDPSTMKKIYTHADKKLSLQKANKMTEFFSE